MRNALTDVLTDTRIERKYMALHAIYNLTHRHKVNQRLFGTNALRDALINLLVNGSQLEKIWVVRSFDNLTKDHENNLTRLATQPLAAALEARLHDVDSQKWTLNEIIHRLALRSEDGTATELSTYLSQSTLLAVGCFKRRPDEDERDFGRRVVLRH